ncbi:transglutaminase domain-containing protein [Candidatus Venteria ishoeyi]|uniref:transglutaminase-like domain-containing protein n=1 Tax=Candidatus Venteria ishoeyi TaxID=1899563 RepID=UPI0025A51C76|nr:transglutaminase domain-containing protein [Candidatus Venteria ishoeyi]MDM8547623.1 transglutaminase domain-containing protein [Candidatus Venteria ishoeyi]
MKQSPVLPNIPVPPYLLGGTLCFWGWQIEALEFALVMALLVELPRWFQGRWEFSEKDFNHLADLSTLLLIIFALYLFSKESINGLFTVVIWMPLLIFLLVLAQQYSSVGSLQLSTLFISLRKKKARLPFYAALPEAQARVDIRLPYMVLCLVAASTTRHPGFFPGLIILSLWLLWPSKPAMYSRLQWLAIFILAIGLGYSGQIGLQHSQQALENWVLEWFEYRLWRDRDPYRQHTAIGEIGELKQSSRILFRVKADYPMLLRQSTYDNYFKQSWYARRIKFVPIEDVQGHGQWQWPLEIPAATEQAASADKPRRITVALNLSNGEAVLPLPEGSSQLNTLAGIDVRRNLFDNTIKVSQAPDMLTYTAQYQEQMSRQSAPKPSSLDIPQREQAVIKALAEDLGLNKTTLTAQEKVQTIADFFSQGFTYSLKQTQRDFNLSPLSVFLTRTRSGHCEYYATATVLLLRAAGISSRYAVGYGVEEYSFLEDAYLVRSRHAHAWALAHVDGAWIEVDNTPADWNAQETEQAHWWQPSYDFFSWLSYRFAQWQWLSSDEETQNNNLLWLLLPFIAFIAWRLRKQKKARKIQQKKPETRLLKPQSARNSAFYQITAHLKQQGYQRPQGTSLPQWIIQLSPQFSSAAQQELWHLLALHQRYRFDPEGLGENEQIQFEQQVKVWLQKYHKKSV